MDHNFDNWLYFERDNNWWSQTHHKQRYTHGRLTDLHNGGHNGILPSGSRVYKMCYVHTMWFNAVKLLKTLKFWIVLHRYGIYCHTYSESFCPEGSEYVWQRGEENLLGRVTDGRSWPYFTRKKITFIAVGKTFRSHFSKFSLAIKSAIFYWNNADQ